MPSAESTRISGAMAGTELQTPVAVVSGVFITAAPFRRKIICCAPPSGQRYTISVAPAVLDQGITIVGGGPPFVMDDEQFGTLVQNNWNCIGSAAFNINIYAIVNKSG
jgi:hypothetical protein